MFDDRNWLDVAEAIADCVSDGHFTLMKFTTHWRAGFVTPGSRAEIAELSMGSTAEDAIQAAIFKAAKK